MAEADKLNIDSIIARLLEGKFRWDIEGQAVLSNNSMASSGIRLE